MNVTTQAQSQFINVTAQVEAEVGHSGIKNGFCTLFVPHTTAGITINENTDPDVVRDMLVTLERLVPKAAEYRHIEGNSDAHVKASLVGFSCVIPIMSGRLQMGTWQEIYFCEFDGPRNRKLKIGLFGDRE